MAEFQKFRIPGSEFGVHYKFLRYIHKQAYTGISLTCNIFPQYICADWVQLMFWTCKAHSMSACRLLSNFRDLLENSDNFGRILRGNPRRKLDPEFMDNTKPYEQGYYNNNRHLGTIRVRSFALPQLKVISKGSLIVIVTFLHALMN